MSNDVSLDINQESNPVQTVAPSKEDNTMLRATDKITALYCRLSVEDTKEKDGKDDPSNSIQHQQMMLMEYAKSRHFPNPTFLWMTDTAESSSITVPAFRRCWQKSKPVMWKR